MNPIKPIPKKEIKNQKNDLLLYFDKEKENSCLKDYQQIQDSISQSQETILIASTSNIHKSIIESLHPSIGQGKRVYILLQDFEKAKETLIKFNQKSPALIREVEELNNNFIIVDDRAFFFLNCLENSENIVIPFDRNFANDLRKLFYFYFWNQATKENIIDKIDTPKKSPYPPFDYNRENVKIVSSELSKRYNKIFVPRKENFKNEQSHTDEFFISEDLEQPIFIHDSQTTIGNLEINLDFTKYLGQIWRIQEKTLQQIPLQTDIIPFDKAWDKVLQIEAEKKRDLGNLRSPKIEDMEQTKPKKFPEEQYVRSVIYIWQVLPPIKPNQAKKAKLYSDYERLQEKFNRDLEFLERVVKEIIDNQNPIAKLLLGASRTAKENLNKIEKYKKIILKKVDYNRLKDLFSEEFKNFYESIVKSSKDFKKDFDRKEQEEKWKKEKQEKEQELKDKEEELKTFIKGQNEKIEKLKEEVKKKRDSVKSQKSLKEEVKN